MPVSVSESAELAKKFEMRKASREDRYKAFLTEIRNSSTTILGKANWQMLDQAGNMRRDRSLFTGEIPSIGMYDFSDVALP